MRVYDNGSYFTVTYTPDDCAEFSRRWPGSAVRGRGSFQFDRQGDLVDATGTAARGEGSGWLEFSQDCELYGRERLSGRPANQAMAAVYARRGE